MWGKKSVTAPVRRGLEGQGGILMRRGGRGSRSIGACVPHMCDTCSIRCLGATKNALGGNSALPHVYRSGCLLWRVKESHTCEQSLERWQLHTHSKSHPIPSLNSSYHIKSYVQVEPHLLFAFLACRKSDPLIFPKKFKNSPAHPCHKYSQNLPSSAALPKHRILQEFWHSY